MRLHKDDRVYEPAEDSWLLCATLEHATPRFPELRGAVLARGTGTGIIALTQMYEGLADDQRRAHHIATELNKMDGLDVDMETVQTNLFRVTTDALGMTSLELGNRLKEHGLGIHMLAPYAFKIALCFNITDEMVEESLDIFRTVLAEVNDS